MAVMAIRRYGYGMDSENDTWLWRLRGFGYDVAMGSAVRFSIVGIADVVDDP